MFSPSHRPATTAELVSNQNFVARVRPWFPSHYIYPDRRDQIGFSGAALPVLAS